MYSEEQLKNKDFFLNIKAKSDDMIIYGEFVEAYDLAKELDQSIDKISSFKDKYFDLYSEYKKIIHKLKWIGLPIMTEEMAVDMFRYHFTKIFSIPDFGYDDLWRKIKSILLEIIVLEERDEFKKNLRNALFNNKEKLTGRKLITNNEEQEPTVGNWIKDYNFSLGTGLIDKLKQSQYLFNSVNVKNLSENEKKRIKILFQLYERLKLSSQTPAGLEEDIPIDDEGRKGHIRGGVFDPADESDKQPKSAIFSNQTNLTNKIGEKSELAMLQETASKYPVGSLERKAIEEEIKKLSKE